MPSLQPFLRTVSAIKNGDRVSLFRFVDAAKIPAIRAFSSVYDATAALQSAFDSGAKRLVAEPGLFNMESTVRISAPVIMEGADDGTVVHQVAVSDRASFTLDSGSATDTIDGVCFRNFVVQNLSGIFLEQQHFFSFNGVRNAEFEGLRLYGFKGDGIYIGSGKGVERHNHDVRIAHCVFDGINNENRNAISVIDADGVVIEDCTFVRCSRANMPGPIDFEPNNHPWHVVRNVVVQRNRFRANGGMLGEIGIYVPKAVRSPPSGFVIRQNESQGYVGKGSFFHHSANRAPAENAASGNIELVGNRASNGWRPWAVSVASGVRMTGNAWSDFKQAALLGYRKADDAVRDVELADETYTRVGAVGGVGLEVFSVDGLSIHDTRFIDCGNGGRESAAVDFNFGSSLNVDISKVNVSAPTGKTAMAIRRNLGHSFDRASNRFRGNDLNGLPYFFAAPDQP